MTFPSKCFVQMSALLSAEETDLRTRNTFPDEVMGHVDVFRVAVMDSVRRDYQLNGRSVETRPI